MPGPRAQLSAPLPQEYLLSLRMASLPWQQAGKFEGGKMGPNEPLHPNTVLRNCLEGGVTGS